ncbi:MAG: hypothetical protein IJI47_05935, partial [Eubacterium sp.]|nr:hypothetical protein [Eubacterium sp.]
DTTINANPVNTAFAFDVCRYSSYPSVNVTVTGNSVVNGDVEIYASKSDPKNGFSLTLESGSMNGDIVVDATAENVLETTPEKAEITKANTFTQTAPEGYDWVDNGDGTSTLERVPADEVSITTADEIDVNLYLDDTGAEKTVTYTFNASPDVQADDQETVTVDFASLPTVGGKKQLTIVVAPAQIRDNIDIDIKNAAGDVVRSYDNYSVAAYCDEIAAGDYTDAVKTLAKSVLDYGKAAANFFGYNASAFTNQADNFNSFNFDTTNFVAIASGIDVQNVRYVATSVPSLRFEVDMTEAEAERYTVVTDKGYAAKFVKVEDKVILQVTGIPASKLGETITVSVKDAQEDVIATIQYTPIIYAYNAAKANNAQLSRLGETIGQYSAAANAVFA